MQEPLPNMPDPTDWLTLREVSEKYDIPYQTLYAAVTSGRLARATPNGTRILVRPADAAGYVKLYRKYQSAQLRTEIK